MSSPDKNEARSEEQELRDEALEEVAAGIYVDDFIETGPPPFFPEIEIQAL